MLYTNGTKRFSEYMLQPSQPQYYYRPFPPIYNYSPIPPPQPPPMRKGGRSYIFNKLKARQNMSRSKSRSTSKSKSSSMSRSKSKVRSKSRSKVRTRSRSKVRSKSRSKVRSKSRSKVRSKSRSKVRTRSSVKRALKGVDPMFVEHSPEVILKERKFVYPETLPNSVPLGRLFPEL